MTRMALVSIWIGCLTGNILWAAMWSGDWSTAADRAWFQGAALAAAYFSACIQEERWI